METIIPQKRCYICTQIKPLDDFRNNCSRSDGKAAECKLCQKEIDAKRQRIRARSSEAMRITGLSHEDYDNVYNQQDGKCAICGKPETSRSQYGLKKLAVDHDHATGKFRGLLCQVCNVKLGILEDSAFVDAALKYLKKHNKLPHEWPGGGRLF